MSGDLCLVCKGTGLDGGEFCMPCLGTGSRISVGLGIFLKDLSDRIDAIAVQVQVLYDDLNP